MDVLDESNSSSSDSDSDSDSSDSSDHSDSSQLSFEFTDQNCQKRLDEFMMVTDVADVEIAQCYLKTRKWNVVKAVNTYFKEMRQQAKAERKREKELKAAKRLDEEAQASSSKVLKVSDSTSAQNLNCSSDAEVFENNSGSTLKLFRHITWNVDGTNEKNFKIRTLAICDIIKKNKVFLVFLQEVTKPAEKIFRDQLENKFLFYCGFDQSADYYTLTLVAKKPTIQVVKNEILNFASTQMGRNIVKTDVTIEGTKLCLMNTHLESTKEGKANRVRQLAFILRYFDKVNSDVTILAGGDLNLRDKELADLGGLPPKVEDAWIATGSRKEVEFTWDMMRNDNLPFYEQSSNSKGTSSYKRSFKPRMRFDRLFIRKSFPPSLDIVHFGLVGIERLKPYVCFPSDHWGVITSYQIYASQISNTK